MDTNDKRMISMFEAVDSKINSQAELIRATLVASEKAITKAEQAAEKRFESVNEFRAALNDNQRTFIPRIEAELLFKQLSSKVDVNTNAILTKTAEGTGIHKGWTLLVGAIGIISMVTSIVLHFIGKSTK